MKVQAKLIILIVCCTVLALGSLAFFYGIEKDRMRSILSVESKSLESRFDKTVTLVGAPLKTFVYDYTFWDEMVAFLQTKDAGWAAENIETSLGTFKAEGAWVYALDGDLIYSVTGSKDVPFRALPLPSGALKKLFTDSPFCHFFIALPQGLLEIQGATIHPSSDVERKTPPAGYFFAGKLWTKEYVGALELLTGTKVVISPNLSLYQGQDDPRAGVIMFIRTVKGWNDLTAGVIQVRGESEPIKIFTALSRITFTIIIWLTVILIIVEGLLLTWWVIIPMGTILRALYADDPRILGRLIRKNDEFGRIAALIQKFFEQRKLLVAEIAVRKTAEAELERSNERFTRAFRSNPSLMTISKLDTGELIEVNDAFVEATEYARDELIGHSTVDLRIMTPKMRAQFVDILKDRTMIRNLEIEITSKSGVKRTCLFSAEKMTIGGREEIMIAVSTDITDRKFAEESLQRQLAEMERFNKLAVGREIKMVELKEKIRDLEERLGKQGKQ